MTTPKRFNTWMALEAGTFKEFPPLPGDTRPPTARISAQVEFFFNDADEAIRFMLLFRGGVAPVSVREGHDQLVTPEPTDPNEGRSPETAFVPWTGTLVEEKP